MFSLYYVVSWLIMISAVSVLAVDFEINGKDLKYVLVEPVAVNFSMCKGLKSKQLINLNGTFTFNSQTGESLLDIDVNNEKELSPFMGRIRILRRNDQNFFVPAVTYHTKKVCEFGFNSLNRILMSVGFIMDNGDCRMKKSFKLRSVQVNKLGKLFVNYYFFPGFYRVHNSYYTDKHNLLCFVYDVALIERKDVPNFLKPYKNATFVSQFKAVADVNE